MPRGEFLGEFGQMLLLAVVRMKDTAYGMVIRDEIEERTGRDISIGSVYSALDRMERRGFIGSHLGEASPERGGRAKRFYQLHPPGVIALQESRVALAALWDDVDLGPEASRP